MHRFILGAVAGETVDHRDGNGLMNIRSNIRICSQGENLRNSRSFRGASQYKGVSWNIRKKKWEARIRDGQVHRGLGNYSNESEAARAYDRAALRLYGEFACLNFAMEVG